MTVIVEGIDQLRRDIMEFDFALPRAQKSFLSLVGNGTVQLLRNSTPVDTGALRDSWFVNFTPTEANIGIRDDDNFAKLNHIRFGVRAHEIDARTGGGESDTLIFSRGGSDIFSTTVFHPGTTPNDFVSSITRSVNEEIVKSLDTAYVTHSKLYRQARKSGAISSTGTFRRNRNITRTVGLSEFSGARRNFGRSTLTRTRTGRISNRRRLSRRRRRGGSILSKKVQALLQ